MVVVVVVQMFNLYISRATEFFGVTRTRDIYEKAIEALPDRDVRKICQQYASMEQKLGEIDRARAIYVHTSQYCDPRVRALSRQIQVSTYVVAHLVCGGGLG